MRQASRPATALTICSPAKVRSTSDMLWLQVDGLVLRRIGPTSSGSRDVVFCQRFRSRIRAYESSFSRPVAASSFNAFASNCRTPSARPIFSRGISPFNASTYLSISSNIAFGSRTETVSIVSSFLGLAGEDGNGATDSRRMQRERSTARRCPNKIPVRRSDLLRILVGRSLQVSGNSRYPSFPHVLRRAKAGASPTRTRR
jgi:hypothetical protein